jgi:polyhydroxyalkanoate synthesis repressor PhaR
VLQYVLQCSIIFPQAGAIVKGEELNQKTILIKKYENRRLYDMTNSKYVNLDEIAQFVREGIEVKVTDAVTGEDLTRLILTQIIIEDAKTPGSAFPVDVLRQMVAAGRVSQESAMKYMKAVFDMYQNAYQSFPVLSPFGLMPNMPGRMGTVPQSAPPQPAAPEPKPENVQPSAASEVADMKRRIEELESIIADARAHAQQRNSASEKRAPKPKKKAVARRK